MSEACWSDRSLGLIQERLRRPAWARPEPPPRDQRYLNRANGDLAEELVPVALELVGLVRDEGPEAIGAFLARLDRGHWAAMMVILAALVPDDRTAEDLLAWVDWDTPQQLARKRARGATHCDAGHELTEDNLRPPADCHPVCLICDREKDRDYKRAQRARAADGAGDSVAA
jgi:hypothetical protein